MQTLLIIAGIGTVAFLALFAWCACAVGGAADDRADAMLAGLTGDTDAEHFCRPQPPHSREARLLDQGEGLSSHASEVSR